MPPKFELSVHSLTIPPIPPQDPSMTAKDYRSPLIPSSATPTSPLSFTISLPSARPNDPLYPASHLQLSYIYKGTGSIFLPRNITSKDLILVESETDETGNVYKVEIPGKEVARPKVNEGGTTTADLDVYAWKGEKYLGKWNVGKIEGLGLVGFKPYRLATITAAEGEEETTT